MSPLGGAGSAVVAGVSSAGIMSVENHRGVGVWICRGTGGVASSWRPSYALLHFGFFVLLITPA